MERATGIGGVFVRSERPEALREWYADHLGLGLQGFGGAVLRSSGGETLTWRHGNRFELWEPAPGH